MRAYTYIKGFCQLFSRIFATPSRSIAPLSTMTSNYTCTVSVSTEAGNAPEDAKAHHVKDKKGRLVSFENPNPSFGIFRDISFTQGLSMFLRYANTF